ncbi:DapH/DapD/GlmU-related protein [Dietzia maris]
MSSTHNFEGVSEPIADQGIKLRPTVICNNVWIGAQSVIVAGVKIGSGSVIAANAVVTRDVDPYMVVAGSPARVIRRRGD